MIDQIIANVSQLDLLVNHLYSLERSQDRFEPVLHITVKPYKPKRTLAQNRLMWMWNGEIAKWLFEHKGLQVSSEDVHEYLVEQIHPMEVNPLSKKERRAQTSKFKIDQMTHHLERMEHYCAERGLSLTHPVDYELAMND